MTEEAKSFDDSELEDIMKEIEGLEQGKVVDSSPVPEDEELKALNDIDNVAAPAEEVEAVAEMEPVEEMEGILDSVIEGDVNDKSLEKPLNLVEEVDLEVEEMLEKLDSEEVEETIVSDNKIVNIGNESETQMDFTVKGNMDLNLNFNIKGQSIKLCVSETKGFLIEMDGGATFTLPISTSNKKSNAA